MGPLRRYHSAPETFDSNARDEGQASNSVCDWTNKNNLQNLVAAVVEGTLDNRFPMGATIDALDVALAYNGVVFGSMNMSSLCIAASAASTLGPMTVALTVSDLPTFNAYAGAMFTEDWVPVTATGSSKVHAFGVTLGVDLNKELAMRGMSGLQDPPAQVLDQVITSGEADRINMQATATLFKNR